MLQLAHHVRTAVDADGGVLLDLRSGRYVALNAVGTCVVAGLREHRSMPDVVCEIAERYGVSQERVAADVDGFLRQLEADGLAEPITTARATPLQVTPGPAPLAASSTTGTAPAAAPSFLSLCAAFLGLMAVDATVKTLGFARIHGWLHRHRRVAVPAPPTAHVQRLSASIDRAAAMYFRRAWCLERSITAVLLMRLRGWPAELVLGVKRLPFTAHAWVELEGRVVNDDPRVQRQYVVLERCGA